MPHHNSPVRGFRVREEQSSIPSPHLIAPKNKAINQKRDNLLLQWESVTSAPLYEIQLSTNKKFTRIVFSQQGLTNTTQVLSNLLPSKNYFWRVRAYSGNASGTWSKINKFTTGQ